MLEYGGEDLMPEYDEEMTASAARSAASKMNPPDTSASQNPFKGFVQTVLLIKSLFLCKFTTA